MTPAATPAMIRRPARAGRPPLCAMAGFSLVELIVVIVVLGILASSMAVFMNSPVRAYFDSQRRAALADAADTALRRLSRDLQGALPNSVRITTVGNEVWLEFVPLADAGRYRAAPSAGNEAGGTDTLDLADPADTSFQVLGPAVTLPAGAQLVVFNLGAGASDVYGGQNRRSITTAPGSAGSISFTAAGTWPAGSPEHRFSVVTLPVSVVCRPAPTGGVLERYDNYAFAAGQPTTAPAGATRALLVDRVTACEATLSAALANVNSLALSLTLGDATESVRLQALLQLPNTP